MNKGFLERMDGHCQRKSQSGGRLKHNLPPLAFKNAAGYGLFSCSDKPDMKTRFNLFRRNGVSPQRAVTTEPTQAADKRPAARLVRRNQRGHFLILFFFDRFAITNHQGTRLSLARRIGGIPATRVANERASKGVSGGKSPRMHQHHARNVSSLNPRR